jgi:hypothetical protein
MAKQSSSRPESTGRPKLLSGGNPQIPKGDGDEAVTAYIAAMPGWKRGVGERLDELIVGAVPGVTKAVRWNSPFYGVAGEGWCVSFHCFTKYVKLTFFRGSELDPVPPVSGKDEHARAIHLFEGDELDEPQLTSWFTQAAGLPGWTPG